MKIYYHLRSTVKRERLFDWTEKMFRLEHETMNVCFIVASISATLRKKS